MPEADGSEPHGLEAQFFTESKLLQQEVEVMLESCNKSNNMLIASVFHPMGNIAEALLKFGYAKTVDWSLKVVTEGSEKYRAAEKHARYAVTFEFGALTHEMICKRASYLCPFPIRQIQT